MFSPNSKIITSSYFTVMHDDANELKGQYLTFMYTYVYVYNIIHHILLFVPDNQLIIICDVILSILVYLPMTSFLYLRNSQFPPVFGGRVWIENIIWTRGNDGKYKAYRVYSRLFIYLVNCFVHFVHHISIDLSF